MMRKYYEKNFMPINLTTLKKKKERKETTWWSHGKCPHLFFIL